MSLIIKKENILLTAIMKIFQKEKKGEVLDLGCGGGGYSFELHKMGFNVTATDISNQFRYRDLIKFVKFDSNKPLPFDDNSFDYVLLAETIEHLKDPYGAIKEINRILKKRGKLILSTPNILNLKSRMRYLIEGTYEYFREPPVEHLEHNRAIGIDESQVHVIAYRYHDLEFLLKDCGFNVNKICTTKLEGRYLSFLIPIIRYQLNSKAKRSQKKEGIDFFRINEILLRDELLFGRHLIVSAEKE